MLVLHNSHGARQKVVKLTVNDFLTYRPTPINFYLLKLYVWPKVQKAWRQQQVEPAFC